MGTDQQKPLTQQTSNQSKAPADIENKIDTTSRRSQYIRFKKIENVAKEFKTRVSNIFAFETPRSSTDTFGLSEQQEPINDDITTYKKLHSQKNNNRKKNPKVFILYLLTKQLITNVTITTAL